MSIVECLNVFGAHKKSSLSASGGGEVGQLPRHSLASTHFSQRHAEPALSAKEEGKVHVLESFGIIIAMKW